MTSRIITINEPSLDTFEPMPADKFRDNIASELTSMARKRAVPREGNAVRTGDVVGLSMNGPSLRFTKPATTVSVGTNLFDEEFERNLLGLPIGATATINSSEGPVDVEIKSIHSREVPEPSDNLVKELTDGRFATVDEYRKVRFTEQQDEYATGLAQNIYENTIDHSTFELDSAGLQIIIDAELERCRRLSADEGLVFEEMTRDELSMRVGVETMEELLTMIDDHARFVTSGALLGAHYTSVELGEVSQERVVSLCEAALNHYRSAILNRAETSGATR